MKNFIIAFLSILFLVLPVFSDTPDEKLHQKCLYPTVPIFSNKYKSLVTGTIVRSTKIVDNFYYNVVITCGHGVFLPCKGCYEEKDFKVLVPHYENWSTIKGAQSYEATIYDVDEKRDIAIFLFASEKKMPTADFGFDEELFIGNEVYFFGCGLQDQPRYSSGKVSGVKSPITAIPGTNPPKKIRTTAYAVSGDSGSSYYSDYKIVGITHAVKAIRVPPFGASKRFNGISYATPISALKKRNEDLEGGLSFVYDKKKDMPILAMFKLFLKNNKVNKEMVENRWLSK